MLRDLKNYWYGPIVQSSAHTTYLGPAQISVTDVQGALIAAERSFERNLAAHKEDQLAVVVRADVAGQVIYPLQLADIQDHEWESASFVVGLVPTSADPKTYSFQNLGEASYLGIHLGRNSASVSALPSTRQPWAEGATSEALDRAVSALTASARQITPRWRWARIEFLAWNVALVGLWLWAMLASRPALPVWLLTAAIVGVCVVAHYRATQTRRLRPGPGMGHHGAIRVDLTPRRQVEADRLNRHRDARVALIYGIAGTILGALGTKLLGV